jgi:predicted metal-binding transcription factor (methanogenesis marker protein 9)
MQPKMIVEPYNQNLRCEMNRCNHKGQWAIGREGGPKAARTIWCDDCLRSITFACLQALPVDYRNELLEAIGMKLEEAKLQKAENEKLKKQIADMQAEQLKVSMLNDGVIRKAEPKPALTPEPEQKPKTELNQTLAAKKPVQRKSSSGKKSGGKKK